MDDSLNREGLPFAPLTDEEAVVVVPPLAMGIESKDEEIAEIAPVICHQCCVCFESFEPQEGLCCGEGHFLCRADLEQYCSENVFTKLYKVRDDGGRVSCPQPSCDKCFDSLSVAAHLPPAVRRRYQNLLTEVVNPVIPKVLHLAHIIRDVLTLCCPSCKVAIDPNPDACSAVMCLNCSAYYCNCCFAKFDSKDSVRDRADAHEHASTHNTNDSKDPFLSLEIVAHGQREFQKKKMTKLLETLLTSKDYAVDGAHVVALSLVVCFEDIEQLQISPTDLWAASLQAILPSQAPTSPRRDEEETTEQHLSNAEDVGNRGAQQLAQAMLSGNVVATKQILSSFRDSLDVNFVARSEVESENIQVVEYPLTSLAIVMSMDWLAIELIKFGADLFAKDNINGRTVLYIALEKGSERVVQAIFEMHPNLDLNQPLTEEDAGYSAMHIVARYDQAHLVSLLLQHGADVDIIEGEKNYSPLSMAVVLGNIWTALSILKAGARLNNISNGSLSPLFIIAEKGILHLLDEFVKRQPNIVNEAVDELQSRAIHVAIKFKNHHFVRQLVSYGANINVLDAEDMSPLMTAIQYGDIYSAMFLMEQDGIDIFNSWIEGRNSLYLIVERGYDMLLQKLLDRFPALINERCTMDDTSFLAPMHVAIQCNQLSILELLLRKGADINIIEGELNLSPIMLAAVNDNASAFQMIVSKMPSIEEPTTLGRKLLFILAERGHIDMFQMVLRQYTNIDINAVVSTDGNQFIALHAACVFNRPQMVNFLADLGADPLICDSNGSNALHLAEQYGSVAAKQAIFQRFPALESSASVE